MADLYYQQWQQRHLLPRRLALQRRKIETYTARLYDSGFRFSLARRQLLAAMDRKAHLERQAARIGLKL